MIGQSTGAHYSSVSNEVTLCLVPCDTQQRAVYRIAFKPHNLKCLDMTSTLLLWMQFRSLTNWIRNLRFAGWYYFTNQQLKLSMYAFNSNAALPGRHATMYQVGPRPMLRCTPQRNLYYIAVCLKQPPSCMQQVPFSRSHSGLEFFFLV